ncbi:hypothetical protein Taro_046645 [Colocasia esculenta]|uniref:Protein kinase domain-containing protein n=1 Tax=Colocasia esculenta TaxID=4460 RepID=A0A843WZJ8_COLES|nr:hypothetical protein [Colocasia esculenta]
MLRRCRLLPIFFFFLLCVILRRAYPATRPYDIPYASLPADTPGRRHCYSNATTSTAAKYCCSSIFATYLYAATRYANVSGAAFLAYPDATACSTAFLAYLHRESLVRDTLLRTGDRCNLVGVSSNFAAGTRPSQFPTITTVLGQLVGVTAGRGHFNSYPLRMRQVLANVGTSERAAFFHIPPGKEKTEGSSTAPLPSSLAASQPPSPHTLLLLLRHRPRRSPVTLFPGTPPPAPPHPPHIMPLRRLLPLFFCFLLGALLLPASAATCPYDIPYASRLIPPQCYLNATTSSTPTGCCWSVFAAYIYAAIRYANVSGAAFLPDADASDCSAAFSAYLLHQGLVPASLLLNGERCNLVGDPVKFAAGTRPCQFPTVAAVRKTVDLSTGTRLCTSRRGNLTDDQPACVACQNAVIGATFALLDATQSKEIVACGMAATMGIWSVSPPDVGRFSSYSLCMLQILENVGNLGTGSILPSPPPYSPRPPRTVSHTHSRVSHAAKIAAGAASAALALGGAVSCLVLVWIRWRRRSQLAAITTDNREHTEMIGSPLPTDGLYIFTKNELRQATNGFDAKHLLGEGGAGKVYLGKLPSGQQVAIKRVQKKKKVGEFYREVEVLAKLRHRNLTTLVGYCLQDREHALVYEYMPGGNLSGALHHGDLTWSQRVRMAADVAEGLAYLHDLPDGAVVHRDVKPTNVLLGDDLRAKLSDFGVSTVLPSEMTHISTEVKGTRGYVDPEYFSAGHVCESADVYSFGVVLLQLITGLKAVVPTPSGGLESIVQTAHGVMAAAAVDGGAADVAGIVDARLGLNWDRGTVEDVFDMAYRCVRPYKNDRPRMKEVLAVLRRVLSDIEARGGYPADSFSRQGSEPSTAGPSTPSCSL